MDADPKLFLRQYRLGDDALSHTGLEWSDLLKIHRDHVKTFASLETIAKFVTDNLRQVKEVHSLKYRVKDPDHLLEKIIRKKSEDSLLDISPENYSQKITDLIGVRALHLFKEEWIPIHSFITATWDLAEAPTANVRKGDSEELLKQFRELGCEIHEHEYGYRSVHYLVQSHIAKKPVIAEVQVRTIFEEGWSEIDHRTRYPYNLDNVILGALLNLFNRLAGSADEMGTFINFLKNELDTRDKEHEAQVEKLNEQIRNLKIDSGKKEQLQKQVERLTGPYSVAVTQALEALRHVSSDHLASIFQASRAVEMQRAVQLGLARQEAVEARLNKQKENLAQLNKQREAQEKLSKQLADLDKSKELIEAKDISAEASDRVTDQKTETQGSDQTPMERRSKKTSKKK